MRVKYCSQTIYQTLLGCLRLWEGTGDIQWKDRAQKVCKILLQIQKADGGFDIGYDFNFGSFHKKGQSTSPELVGLAALVEFYRIFDGEDVARAARRAAEWIREHSMAMDDHGWAIPYGPYSSDEVMVYNGTSFAATALGVYLSVFPDEKLEGVYHGMNHYLYGVLNTAPGQPGKFWYYSDQGDKIDYYHQMQQVEMHAWAESCLSSPVQGELVQQAAEHVAGLQDSEGLIPYLNTEEMFKDIHLWAYASCASGFILAGRVAAGKQTDYLERAGKIFDWILKHSWNGSYFYPIVAKNGQVVDSRFFVRSDAWVFNALALAVREGINPGIHLEICEKSYIRMEKANFSGIENHASGKRIRMAKRMVQNAAVLKNKLWQK